MKRALLVAVALLSGCRRPATEIVAIVRSDLPLASVRIGAEEDGALVFQSCGCLVGAGCPSLPLSLGLVPAGDGDRPFRVRADGFDGSGCATAPSVTQSATVRFVAEQTLALYLDLDAICKGMACPDGQTCRAGACVDDAVPMLPQYSLAAMDLAVAPVADLSSPADLASAADLAPSATFVVEGTELVDVSRIALGDVDGDQRPDFLIARASLPEVAVYLNQQGNPGSVNGYTIGVVATSLAVGDVDHDGRLDFIDCGPGSMADLYRGKGNGTFVIGPSVTLPDSLCSDLALGQITADLDSDLDLVVATSGIKNPVISAMLGAGNDTFGLPMPTLEALPVVRVVLADVDGDSALDVVTADTNAGSLGVMYGKGDGTFSTIYQATFGTNVSAVVAGDFVGDGTVSLVAADPPSHNFVRVKGDLRGGTAVITSFAGAGIATAVAAADFDGDGKLDLVFAERSGKALIFLNRGGGDFGAPIVIPVAATPLDVAAADLDGDGKPDIAIGGTTFQILRNRL